MNIYAIGQNLLIGKVGHFLVILSFVAALAACLAYFFATTYRNDLSKSLSWKQFGRKAFVIHAVAVLGIIISLLTIIHGHYFEYKYVWEHTSKSLPWYYQFSSMWSGQEGSTLLWMFWHAVLGCVLVFTAKNWESPVLSIVALAQVLLGSMLLGIILFHYKFGSSPFALVRDTMDIPVFKMNPEWVAEDGTGLNPSLQNYWMVIHPPTLFLGFAGCTIPAAYAIASLWVRNFTDWVKPALTWSLFTLMILGAGILLGGAWAYEALSFGGFWAWDPVENASLVPWLVLAAGIHTLMAYKHTGYSLHATYVLFISTFLLVLYSSFLTKSGVLGDASVHSFTDLGMSGQLVVIILAFLLPSVYLFIDRTFNKKLIPSKPEEEKLSSREFWLFIGSLIFVFSAIHIIVLTSFPVINKIFGSKIAPPSDIKSHYNNVQIWMAAIVAIGSAITQFFKYKHSDVKKVILSLLPAFVLSIALTIVVVIPYKLYRLDYVLMVFSAWFALLANVQYIFKGLKGKMKIAGGSVSHIGFAIMIIGILISQGRQEVLSVNQFGIDYGQGFSEQEIAENVLLYQNEPTKMGKYRVTYLGDSVTAQNIYFNVRYEELDKKGNVRKAFTLHPNILMNNKMGNTPVPSTLKTITSDLYTHITSAPLKEDGTPADSLVENTYTISVGDTIPASRCMVVLESINPDAHIHDFKMLPNDIAIGARLKFIAIDTTYNIEPIYLVREVVATSIPAKVDKHDVSFSLIKILPEENKLQFLVQQKLNKFIIMKAIRFPFINVLWLGCLVMTVGVFMSMMRRKKENTTA
ncbi:MAG TPA: cytochrome c biogenesis protein CcsA [Chitinophagales bacterium]|nr:cytochrome c biogenesis protein CcsA [Chitinophagales bacterium]HMW11907.1 cytochrome c biogenesis protein CcsA [Chitinophagales bacterium]HMX59533.1 cytochrome c biogenesis protein CcsA [Chitinophagales bacterium]HMY23123.1 cytochrome c biogenesis protein CcsA [Chitinophagales bacterium]HMZ32994.1 cytochrome c biogenesis protein CcsA [Chitinophagales bacterium]